jgi:hypothetical protein
MLARLFFQIERSDPRRRFAMARPNRLARAVARRAEEPSCFRNTDVIILSAVNIVFFDPAVPCLLRLDPPATLSRSDCGWGIGLLSPLLTEIPNIEQARMVATRDSLVVWRDEVIDRQHGRSERSCLLLKLSLQDSRKIGFLRPSRFPDNV